LSLGIYRILMPTVCRPIKRCVFEIIIICGGYNMSGHYDLVKRLALALALTASAAMISGAGFAAGNGAKPADAPTALAANQGQVLCTAAINSDGSKAGGLGVTGSSLISTGQYEVDFGGACGVNVTAKKGFARWVQVDTLTTGATGPVFCTTADRSGAPNGVYVECFDGSGTATSVSFFLFVAR
jgi:hypothetical protein